MAAFPGNRLLKSFDFAPDYETQTMPILWIACRGQAATPADDQTQAMVLLLQPVFYGPLFSPIDA